MRFKTIVLVAALVISGLLLFATPVPDAPFNGATILAMIIMIVALAVFMLPEGGKIFLAFDEKVGDSWLDEPEV